MFVNSPQRNWAASDKWLIQLNEAIPQNWKLNTGGEVSPYDPLLVANEIIWGGVWIDYCGYPMWYKADVVKPYELGSSGFWMLLNGLTLRSNGLIKTFKNNFYSDQHGFEYPRSLVMLEAKPSFIVPDPQSPKTETIYSSFAIKHPSGGMYLYAYASPHNEGILPSQFYQFMRQLDPNLPPRTFEEEPPVVDPGGGGPVIPPIEKWPSWVMPSVTVMVTLIANSMRKRQGETT